MTTTSTARRVPSSTTRLIAQLNRGTVSNDTHTGRRGNSYSEAFSVLDKPLYILAIPVDHQVVVLPGICPNKAIVVVTETRWWLAGQLASARSQES